MFGLRTGYSAEVRARGGVLEKGEERSSQWTAMEAIAEAVRVAIIDAHACEHGVVPIGSQLPIVPSNYYDHEARQADAPQRPPRLHRGDQLRVEIDAGPAGANLASMAPAGCGVRLGGTASSSPAGRSSGGCVVWVWSEYRARRAVADDAGADDRSPARSPAATVHCFATERAMGRGLTRVATGAGLV